MRTARSLLLLGLAAVARAPAVGGGISPAAAAAAAAAAPLACGTNDDPAADSKQVLDLFTFVTSVCVDQLGEKQYGGGRLPSTCKSAGCARVVDLVSSSCKPSGQWNDNFLAMAFGPMLDPLVQKCAASGAEGMTGFETEFAITSARADNITLALAVSTRNLP